MTKHLVDQPRERSEGARARQYTRIEREHGPGGHARSEELKRRTPGAAASGRRTEEFLRRERAQKD